MKYILFTFILCLSYVLGGTTSEDNDKNVCLLPTEVGTCRGSLPMFTFDASVNECRKFIYGGCNGNGNNFKTKEECESACKVK